MEQSRMLILLLSCCILVSHAQNLIVNGDFETGTGAGWTPSGGAFTVVASEPRNSGSYAAHLGKSSSTSFSQDVPTNIGTTYTVSFYLALGPGTPNTISITFGSTTLFSGTNLNGDGSYTFVQHTANVLATSATTTFGVTYFHSPDHFYLDDVSVSVYTGGGTDPIISGFDGKLFDFTGSPNMVFNMFSMPDLQINALFIPGNKPNETYMGAIGIKQGGKTHITFDLVGAYLHNDIHKKPIEYGADPIILPNNGKASRPTKSKLVLDWPGYLINITRIWERPTGQLEKIEYIDFGITLKMEAPLADAIHGVVGQTFTHTNNVMLLGYYEGHWQDYAAAGNTKDVLTDDFPQKFYKYDPNAHVTYTPSVVPSIAHAVGRW